MRFAESTMIIVAYDTNHSHVYNVVVRVEGGTFSVFAFYNTEQIVLTHVLRFDQRTFYDFIFHAEV